MKFKFRNLFLGIIAIVSAFVFVGCKKDDPPKDSRTQPTVNVSVEQREFYVDDELSTIDISLKGDSTSGTIAWKTPTQKLVEGNNTCEWKFVPSDKNAYYEKMGSVTIVALAGYQDPTVNVVLTSDIVYAENTLETVSIGLSQGDTEGTLEWVNPSAVLIEGEQSCKWKFTPTSGSAYKTIYGHLTINAITQSVVRLEVKTAPSTTAYQPFKTTTLSGMVLTATYDGGKVEDVSSGWVVSYQNGDAITINDTKVVATYGGVSVDVPITVSKIGLTTPQIVGTYIYNGEAQTAKFNQNAYSNCYTVEEHAYIEAGSYQIKLTINDYVNYKWNNSDTDVLYVTFTITSAGVQVTRTEYEGVYDAQAHTATVSANNMTAIYYSTEILNSSNYSTGSTEPIYYTNAGEYTVYYYIVAEINYRDNSGSLDIIIDKAEQDASVKYVYAVVSSIHANVPTSYVESYDINKEAFDLTDKVSFVYYTNYSKKVKTTTASGATDVGNAPKNMGQYYVETTILGNENYSDAIVVSRLMIAPDDCFLASVGEDQQFAWRSDDEEYYGELTKTTANGFTELVLKSRFEGTLHNGRVYQLDNVWYVEYESLETTYKLDYNSTALTVDFIQENETVLATLNKWHLPYYVGTFEHSSGASITIYNDIGLIRFTFTSSVTGTKEGIVDYFESSNSVTFTQYVGDVKYDKYFLDVTNLDLTQQINSITLTKNGISSISGTYTRVA